MKVLLRYLLFPRNKFLVWHIFSLFLFKEYLCFFCLGAKCNKDQSYNENLGPRSSTVSNVLSNVTLRSLTPLREMGRREEMFRGPIKHEKVQLREYGKETSLSEPVSRG